MSYELVVISGADEGQRFEVAEGEMLIGRSGDAAVSLSDDSVAFEHAIVREMDGKLHVQNLSALGTIVRGRKITEETRLAANDEIELSRSCRILVEVSDDRGGSKTGLLIAAAAALLLLVVAGAAVMVAGGGPRRVPMTQAHWRTAYVNLGERMDLWQSEGRIPQDITLLFRNSWRQEKAGDYRAASEQWERLNSAMLSLPTPLLDDEESNTFAQIARPTPKALGVIMGWDKSVVSTDFEWTTDEAYADALVWFVRKRAAISRSKVGGES